jgi:CheY-like chemotaxis protein
MIEDEARANVYYLRALEKSGFDVMQIKDAGEAVEYVRDERNQIDLILLDIMMAPGRYRDRNGIEQGLRTGVFVYEEIRACRPNVPVLVLTNVQDPEALSAFEAGPRLQVARKTQTPPFDLVEIVRGMLALVEQG